MPKAELTDDELAALEKSAKLTASMSDREKYHLQNAILKLKRMD